MATELKLMTIRDDRGEFEERKRTQSIALGNDRATFNKALDALYAADNYDYAYLWSWMGVPIIQLPKCRYYGNAGGHLGNEARCHY